MSHIKFAQTVQKLYKQDICGRHLGFRFLCILCKKFARLSTQAVFVGICKDDFRRPTFYSTPCPSNSSGSLGMSNKRCCHQHYKFWPVSATAPGGSHTLTRFKYGLIEIVCVHPCKHKRRPGTASMLDQRHRFLHENFHFFG